MSKQKDETISVELTHKQFEDLIRCVYLAHWMINGIRTEDDKIKRFDDLEQYMYALAFKYGYTDLVEFVKNRNKFFLKDEFSETNEADGYRRTYDDEMFWSELIQRLTVRDFLQAYGPESLSKLSSREEVERRQPLLRKYVEEFEKNGVQNLTIHE